MSKLLFIVVAVIALFVATNPTRPEFDDWVQQYAIAKIKADARAKGEEVSWGERMFGGASAGMIVRNLPVERRNFIVFSIFKLDLPEGFDDANGFPNCVIGVAGQFIRTKAC